MPIGTPFHSRTSALCASQNWRTWSGYFVASSYDVMHDYEYHAIRNSAGLIDISPLYKYEVRGKDAGRFLARVMVKDLSKLRLGQVTYTCWCDDDGKVVDDGTVTRIEEDHFRVTAAEPSYRWLLRLSRGYAVEIEDSTKKLAALAVQGPTARSVLKACTDADLDGLKFFRMTRGKIAGLEVFITRTGYTGDLGYEVWVAAEQGPALWDAILAAGKDHGIEPCGLDALDMTRVEAGFILLGVDYYSAPTCVIESRKSSPFEIGLEWTLELDREPFVGQEALAAEKERGSPWRLMGVELSWEELESLYDGYGLPPSLPAEASRTAIPLYVDGRQVGQITSSTWSPVLKKSIGLASLRTPFAEPGQKLRVEHTVEYERRTVNGTVVKTPFYNPERKRKP